MTRKRPFEISPELYPFEDHWFERDGKAMHYVDHGEGVPVILMHGNPTWSFLYRDVIKALDGAGVRCLAPDYLGFGLSDAGPQGFGYTFPEHAEAIGAWIDHLALDQPFVMVVQDWGGPIGLTNAVQRPEQVGALCIMNTWAWPPNTFFKLFSHALGGWLGKRLIEKRNLFADKLVRDGIHTVGSKPPEVLEAYTAPFPDKGSRYPTWVFPREIRMHDDRLAKLERDLATLKGTPIEMIWGMQDKGFGNEKIIARWHEILGEVPTQRTDEASHFLQEDVPDEIAATIERLVAQIS